MHHTDAEREFAYDRTSSIGRLDRGLDEAKAKGWTVMDMKMDWKIIFTPEKKVARNRLSGVLQGKKVAHYLQIENKIRAAIRYELAAGIPLAQ